MFVRTCSLLFAKEVGGLLGISIIPSTQFGSRFINFPDFTVHYPPSNQLLLMQKHLS